MRILLFGGSGGLGQKLLPFLNDDHEVLTISSKHLDVTNRQQLERFFNIYRPQTIIMAHGYNYDSMLHNQNLDESFKQIKINIIGLLNVLKFSLPVMRKEKFGRIIAFSSVLAVNPIKGTAIYNAGKSFIDNIIRTCAQENAKYGITCNSIRLGYFDGGMTNRVPPKILEQVMNNIPLNRLGRISELYNAIEFLIKTEYATGLNLDLSGGLHI